VEARAGSEKPRLTRLPGSGKPARAKEKRRTFLEGRWVSTPIYDGESLKARQKIEGPAIIEERLTTVVIYRGQTARLDTNGIYHIE
jgi:N-methylhydantoinase A/oxoprolinase/acetone carboxylase beta subunit